MLSNADIVSASRGEAWHWHISLVRELQRLQDIAELPIPADAVAGNVRFTRSDTARYLRELESWGLVAFTEARRWDYPGVWVTLAGGDDA